MVYPAISMDYFWSAWKRLPIAGIRRSPSWQCNFAFLNPLLLRHYFFLAGFTARACALKLTWFLRDFGYDTELLSRDQVEEKALVNLRGVVRTTYTNLNGHSYQNLEAFAPTAEWDALSCLSNDLGEKERSQDAL